MTDGRNDESAETSLCARQVDERPRKVEDRHANAAQRVAHASAPPECILLGPRTVQLFNGFSCHLATSFRSNKMADPGTEAAEHDLAPLSNQVAGHPDGVQSLQGGRLVVKACLPRELAFYNEVEHAAEGKAGLENRQVELLRRLLKVMPECHGSWKEYTGSLSETETTDDDEAAPRIVLENLTYGYGKPNVCDIKLGTQLWDEDASEEKRQRMDKVAANTTSGSHGIRLTGWQVR